MIAQGFTAGNAADKYIFAFDKNGNGLFYGNKTGDYSFEKIDFPDNKYPEIFYSVIIDGEQYLLSTQVLNEVFLIDYQNKDFKVFTFDTNTFFSDDFFILKGYNDESNDKVYFTDYIFCKEYGNYNECFLGLRIFKLNKDNINTLLEKNDEIQVNSLSQIKCFQNEDLYIQCIYSTKEKDDSGKEIYNRAIALFDKQNLNLVYKEILQEDYNRENTFESTIQLNGNIFVTGFSLPHNRNIIKLLLKQFVIKSNQDIQLVNYLPEIDHININEDKYYLIEAGLAKRNNMIKISEDKFAILLNEFTNSSKYSSFNKNLLILILTIFDNSKISIRHYTINFELYNLLIYEDIRGYTLNNFFGVLLETGINTNSYQTKATFLTFGYINSTLDEIPIDKNLKLNNDDSVIKLGNYISEIENNLFKYNFVGIQIIEIPNEEMCGYFVKKLNNERIQKGDIFGGDIELKLVLEGEKFGQECSIDFAGLVNEPDYDEMNENAERVDIYPVNDTKLEEEFYRPQLLIGRVIKYRYEVGCYESCQGCIEISSNPKDQQCINCKDGYYFQEGTNNCFQSLEGYYLNETHNVLSPCYSACATCDGPKVNNIMNCLTCKEGLKLYGLMNCLNCPKYVNYELTECLDEIPEGYYLNDKELGTLEKCHHLCKTCEGPPIAWTMNCVECKYTDPNFIPNYKGNCPAMDDYEEEEEIIMPGGECPRSKPILVSNDFCYGGYCGDKEFQEKICVISNSIIKTQWLNNIQRLGDDFFFVCLDYGENGDLFLFAQKRDIANETYENALYGFNKYGGPLFIEYKENGNEEYYSYKKMKFPKEVYFSNIKFIKNLKNQKTFLLSTAVEDEMYEINYHDGNTFIHNYNELSYSSEDILSLKKYQGEYISYFIFCEGKYDIDKCYPYFRKFQFDSNNEIEIIKEVKADININYLTNFICLENANDFLICIYSERGEEEYINKHILGIFDINTLEEMHKIDIDSEFETDAFFDSMISLNDDAFVLAFSTEKDTLRVIIKTIINNYNYSPTLYNYINSLGYIDINENNHFKYNNSYSDRNSLCRINDDKFALLINSFNSLEEGVYINPNIEIYIFSIFNKHQNLNMRRYSINFKLYNTLNGGKILGYNLGQFFGILIELLSTEDKQKINSAFITFGYVNTTNASFIFDNNFIPEDSLISKSLLLNDYIGDIENNLFGYESVGAIILSLPNENIGYFIKGNDEKISINEKLSINTEIKLKLKDNYTPGIYSIVFAATVKEPSYDNLNKYAEEIFTYPENKNADERDFYEPQVLIGGKIEYKFELKGKTECYPSCSTCYSYSSDDNNHQCKTCKYDYYFKESTFNCYKEINEYYYFNEEIQKFSPCYSNCLTCSNKERNSTYMNCLSCEKDYIFYEKTKNCLNCPNYVNYLQTECIDTIPNGYYLADEKLKTIEKCYFLCKTCSGGPFDLDNELHMNCEICLYENKNFIPPHKGDCPADDEDYEEEEEKEEEKKEEEKEEEESLLPGDKCPRNKPILVRNSFCFDGYCSLEEFKKKMCVISNSIIKTQWMNNIQRLGEDFISICLDYGENGDLYLLAQRRDFDHEVYENNIYGFNKYGGPLFSGSDEYYSYKTIPFPKEFYFSNIKFIKNLKNDNIFLLTTAVLDEMYEIDFFEDNTYIHNFNELSYSSEDILSLKRYPGEYISYFIFCEGKYDVDKCYPYFRKFQFDSNNVIDIIKEVKLDINITYLTNFICLENTNDFLICIYSERGEEDINKHLLGIFDINTFEEKYYFNIDLEFETEAFFDSMISLNDDAFVIAFSTERDILRVIIKSILYNPSDSSPSFQNYIDNIDYIDINEDNLLRYNYSYSDRNSLCKINDDKFALLINSFNDLGDYLFENSNTEIYIFSIFNKHQNVNIRRYSINFKLYNTFSYGKVIGYNLGQFFGIFIELSSTEDKEKTNSAFMTFGYVNTTKTPYIYDNDFIPENSQISKSLLLSDYFGDIENNLFGYESIGVIILFLPDDNIGYFIKENGERLSINEQLNLDTEIKFKLKDNYSPGIYSIIFAATVKEPSYDNLDKYAEKVYSYPKNSDVNERDFYEPQILVGGKIEYKFELKGETSEECYPSCAECFTYSVNEENHQCKICKPGYYFKEDTYNCYKEINLYYYFNEELQVFSPCYPDCLTCDNKEINSTYMNCLSCEENYNYYEKSKNCLQCPKYVNYLQTECIDTIPDGYYLSNEKLKTIEKCYNLCKTCKAGPYEIDDDLHMNCESCLYKNNNFHPRNEGDCPSSNEDESPVDGQCSRENPILKNNKCQNIFCTEEEYDSGICQIYNDYIKTQWLNNFHSFPDMSNYISYDINENGDLFLMAQKKDSSNIIQYIYGFNSNGEGIFYDSTKKKYNSYMTVSNKFSALTEKIKYIEINKEGHLINIIKDSKFYLIDYSNNNDIYTQSFLYLPSLFDTIIKLKNKNNIYLFDFIYCLDESSSNNCYLGFINYKIDKKNEFTVEKTNSEEILKVNYNTKLSCFENGYNVIQCKYSINKDDEKSTYLHIISLFNRDNFELTQNFLLDELYSVYKTFDSMIQLKDNVCVIAYSTDPNVIKVLIKKLSLDETDNTYKLDDYVYQIENIKLNEDLSYELKKDNFEKNNLIKINEDEFAIVINNCKDNLEFSDLNTGLVIITFHIYNMNRNIIIRHYKIDLNLYHVFINGNVMGYKLGEFIGVFIEGTSPNQKENSRAAFLTFGYVNATEDISYEDGTNNLINNKNNIKINEYIYGIENNLFGYEFLGVKILSLPDENKAGYFINLKNNKKKISVNDIIDINSELQFVSNSNPIKGDYTISFAGAVREPEYKVANELSNKVEFYPSGALPEKYFDEIKTLIGKEFKYNFRLSGSSEQKQCYKNCETCIRPSEDINNQDCITCKKGFYFKDGTKNCYDEIAYQYYFNEETEKFYPCYSDCYTCKTKEINSTYMNCLSCHNFYKLYEKTKNCLKCTKYVNYLQTECIDTIPDGYYLSDSIFGTIEKCHNLCKTCKSGPTMVNNEVHMNCETCLYQSSSKVQIEGNCPEPSIGPEQPDNEDKKKENESSSNGFAIAITIIIVILVLIIIGCIIYLKCYQNRSSIKKNDNTDYYNIGGKIIPFDD